MCTMLGTSFIYYLALLGIRIRMFWGLPDPDLVRGADPDPDPHQNVTDPEHCYLV
jgi:hypothetical protein